MDLKKRIFSGVCALSILTCCVPAFAETSETVESISKDKEGIHRRMNYRANIDFSAIEELTDEQKSEFVGFQDELKGYMEKQKEVQDKIVSLMKEYGIEDSYTKKNNIGRRGKNGGFFNLENLETLTDEQKENIEALQNELKEIQENKKEINKKTEYGTKVELTDAQKETLETYRDREKEINTEIKSLLEEYGVELKTKNNDISKSEKLNGGRKIKSETTESSN